MKFIRVEKNVLCWTPRGSILAILYKDKAISILHGCLPKIFCSGIYFQIKCSAKRDKESDYDFIGYGFSLLPDLQGSVGSWPKWYFHLNRFFSWRSYDVCRVLKNLTEYDWFHNDNY